MFFHEDLVTNKRFRNVWRAAHNQKADINEVQIPKVCNSISKLMDDYSDNKLRHLSFRTAYKLLLGTVKTYKEQLDQLSNDAFNLAFEMEYGIPNVGITGNTSKNFEAYSSSDKEDEEHSHPGDRETSSNCGDPHDNEEEMNGNTRAESEEHCDLSEKETSINYGDADEDEEETNGNTRAETRSSFESGISNVTRQLSPVIEVSRTTVVSQTANDIRSSSKRKSDDEECRGEGTSNMAVTTTTHRPEVMKTSQEVQTNKSFIKNQKLKELYRRKDPVFDNGLPLAHTIIYAPGSRRPVRTIWSNVNPDVMKL